MTQLDFDTDDDELLSDFDDEAAEQAAAEGREREFMQEVQRNIKTLRDSDSSSAQRVASAYWLGESGEPTAISTLVGVYQTTNERALKQATAYALSQFKALDEALNGNDQELADHARELYAGIVLRGEFGKRSTTRRGPLLGCSFLLLLTFVGLLAAAVILPESDFTLPLLAPGEPQDTPTATATPSAESVLIDVQRATSDLSADASQLLIQLQLISRQQGTPDCNLQFSNRGLYAPPAFISTEAFPDLSSLIARLNSAAEQTQEVQSAFEGYCTDPSSLSRQQAADLQGTITEAQVTLRLIQADLAQFDFVTPTPTATNPPTETPTATVTPSPTLTPTRDIGQFNTALLTVQTIASNMTQQINGPASRLLGHWQDIQRTGDTGACQDPTPPRAIAENYTPPADVIAGLPEIEAIAANVNLGLEQTRASWEAFAQACNQGRAQKVEAAGVQVQVMQNALDAFNTAQALITALQQN